MPLPLTRDEINKINLRYSSYKDVFRTSSGKISLVNTNLLAEFIASELETRRTALLVENLGKGVLLVRNTKTLQSMVVWLSIGKSAAKSFTLTKDIVSSIKDCLVFHLHSTVKSTNRVGNIQGSVILSSHFKSSKKYNYISDYRLPVYKDGPYNLTWY